MGESNCAMSRSEPVTVSVHTDIGTIPAEEWDSCAGADATCERPHDPFTTHRFLNGLEVSGSVGEASGWHPIHLVAHENGTAIAAMPLYVKYNSQGEFVFDHGWANAFMRAGGSYYPKLQAAVPFTPVPGRRFLARPGKEQAGFEALATTAASIAEKNSLSSLHITYCTSSEANAGKQFGFLCRTGNQFTWTNEGYGCFEEFLSALTSRKRRNIRKERRIASRFGGRILAVTGTDIEPEHWDAFWMFYQDTGMRKWGIPYLTREFFSIVHDTMREDVLLILCERDGRLIAGALNFIGRDTLFGRYWGCIEHHPCLHFEVCYYQAIEFAIAQGLRRVDAGAQGEHKLARGYMPAEVHSLHWIANASFRRAVSEYLDDESKEMEHAIDVMAEAGPFKKREDLRE